MLEKLIGKIKTTILVTASLFTLYGCKEKDTLYEAHHALDDKHETQQTISLSENEEKQHIDPTLLDRINNFDFTKAEQYIQQHQEQWMQEYLDLLRFKTISGEGEDESEKVKAVQYLKQLFEKRGFGVKLIDIEYHNGTNKGKYPIVYLEKIVDKDSPTILFDTHYDVRPRNDNQENPWISDPFTPVIKDVEEKFGNNTIKDKRIFARGADDSKGHIMALLIGLELSQNVYGGLPVNVKLLLEGTEETGSYGMDEFIDKNKQLLDTDVVVIADAPTLRRGIPTILYGLRGYMGGEICIKTADKDKHSGTGSYIPNAVEILAYIVSQLQNPFTGEVSFPEFYEGIKQPSVEIEQRINQQYKNTAEGSEETARKDLQLKNTVGDITKTPAVRTTIYPSLDFQKIDGGGEGIIPSFACVKYSRRLVNGQNHEAIKQGFEGKVKNLGVDRYATVLFSYQKAGAAFFTNPDSLYQQIAGAALKKVFGSGEIDMIIDGASEPIASYYQQSLKRDIIFVALGNPADNCHAPNESMLWNHGVILGAKATVGLMYGYSTAFKR